MTQSNNRSALERFLGVFAEVRVGEGVTALLLTLNLFFVLSSYYAAKVLREPLILTGGGAEVKSYLSAIMVFLLLGAVKLYAVLAEKFPRRKLINIVNIFFIGCMIVFYLLAQAGLTSFFTIGGVEFGLGVLFFLWVGMFNVMVVAQFWSFANDIYTPQEGKRLFAIVAFGASSGAVAGSWIAGQLIDVLGLYQLLIAASVFLGLSLIITNIVDQREKLRGVAKKSAGAMEEEPAMDKDGAFKLVFSNKYLLMIAVLILILNWVNTNGEYILGRMVSETAQNLAAQQGPDFSEGDYIGKFYGNFFTGVNFLGMVIQLFLVSRILKYFGIRIAILILPVIAMGGYMILAFFPILNIVRWMKTAENATDYSLQNTVRHALFLPTSREEKYKAKQAIDSFFHRSGDVFSALLVFVGVSFLDFSTKGFAFVNIALVAVWIWLAVQIGKENQVRVAASEAEQKG